MGHRANFVIIKEGKATAYEDQWAGGSAAYEFSSGELAAAKAIELYEETNELMDWAFAEGGYLIDYDQKLAIAFGMPFDAGEFFDDEEPDELVEADPAINKLLEEDITGFLEDIAEKWPSWKIVWDERGVDAFALHLKSRNIDSVKTAEPSHPAETKEAVSYPK
ncbi:hypothetical protein [Persicirhabdus sediminis]|uniref:Uncharacterized protein n=1 Tax=Persicirhabdus sediminis TaxID=454144 RepID=A0A8J7MEW4_9BACT|nr:hypothetical protein [Persicirhabdus sediminis]MBK1792066.1 hypothetical protein [Persicirhabdus sediminis]